MKKVSGAQEKASGAQPGDAKKFCRQYKATTACTVRLLYKMGLNETDLHLNCKKKRCVFGDSWFASVDTALALKKELGVHFTGR